MHNIKAAQVMQVMVSQGSDSRQKMTVLDPGGQKGRANVTATRPEKT